jgi:FkbM family methyltransferase
MCCHIGSFLSHILRICPSGRLTAIEPSPEKAAWLRSRYPRVTVHSVAVGDRSGTAIYYEKENDPGRSRIDDAIPNAKQVIVDVRTLDHLLLDEPKIDFIKLDIEAAN